ncbi:TPA: SPASM domain-containing protein [Clostridioides difficile]
MVTKDSFTIDRSLIKELDNYRHKVIWKVYSRNDDTRIKLKEDIKITSLIKRGHTVVRRDREKAIKIEDMRFKDTKERFSKYGAEWSHLYISSNGNVKSYSFQKDKRVYLGNIFNNSVEEIFLEMQNKIDKLEIVYQ